MTTKSPIFVCFGNPKKQHFKTLVHHAINHEPLDWWTINSNAKRGARVVFYMIAPISGFVATGVVAEDASRVIDKKNEWHGDYAAKMTNIQLLRRPAPLADAKRRFPDWAFLRQPRRSSLVPANSAKRFVRFLGSYSSKQDSSHYSEIEGTKTEVRYLKNQRSRRLRNLAFDHAKGICAVCERDFSELLNGQGLRVLQVHHRNQLSVREAPSLTSVAELAVVCANCHMLLHLDPMQCLSVKELRSMLARDGFFE